MLLRHDTQIVDLVWIDPAAIGLATGAAANIKNLLADAQTNYVLLRAESNFPEILADQNSGRVHLVRIGGTGRLLKRELWVVWLVAQAMLGGRSAFYTSWLPRLCFSVLLLPIKCRLFVHDLNIFRGRIHDGKFRQPSWLSRLHQYLSIKRATVVQCFARSVARQLKLLRRDKIAVVGQTVRIVPPDRSEKRGGSAVIFLDDRDYKGTWALDRFYTSKIGFQLTVIGKINELQEKRLTSRGLAVRSLRPSDKDKFLLIAEADFVIFASKYEGFGLPPREAAAAGTPSLIARRAALLDIPAPLSLSIERCGSRIDLDDVAKLATRIDRVALKQWAAEFIGPVSTSWSLLGPLQ
jgi:glycosyltransferase involved in cell wall biosynthesis